jgi:large subunit ribosomal protein L10
MDNPRPEKVAVVDEVRDKLSGADAAILTEYRGIDVAGMAELRGTVRDAGGEYKIYKNTLVRLAVRALDLDLEELLLGPTAICFVPPGADGKVGDPAAVAKALKEFSKKNEFLVLKGGILGDKILSAGETSALADLPSREQLFSEFAGAMESKFQEFAGLLDAKMREFSYAMQELLDKGVLKEGEAPAPAPAPDAAAEPAPADESEAAPAESETEAPADEAPADEAPAQTDDEAAPADASPENEANTEES